MLGAVLWGAVAASSLLCGALLSMVRAWSDRSIGTVLGFGAGALIASVSFELAEDGFQGGGAPPVAIGLALGAAAYFTANGIVARSGAQAGRAPAGTALALGALLDGIPEQAVLGLSLGTGESVSIALLVAVFVSNLPESAGSSAEMLQSGKPRSFVIGLWSLVTAVCIAATWAGAAVSTAVSSELTAGIKGFAAGALLVMLVDSMIPDAKEKASDLAGLATVVGFALAAGMSLMG
ncbi:ZIP family zinc transporter [Brevibacterium sanguinis]|uniref:ZIP family zinc transporter n=2 Tax=Brevibacterium TaxID=1696 RepID=A0A366IKM9_9MICO|nr:MULTISPECIES: hypothetical protein [Brevibacterium]RBP65045.1 ZIP family zinc transporter [Brevibacterium sanguinis]RBP71308.1 ZIP family zinc transporter [Brevibacterium celere]